MRWWRGLARLTAKPFLVIHCQAKDYHDAGEGAFYELPLEGSTLRTNTQADNMTAKNLLGLADYLKRKSTNTTTSDWLEKIRSYIIHSISLTRTVVSKFIENLATLRQRSLIKKNWNRWYSCWWSNRISSDVWRTYRKAIHMDLECGYISNHYTCRVTGRKRGCTTCFLFSWWPLDKWYWKIELHF